MDRKGRLFSNNPRAEISSAWNHSLVVLPSLPKLSSGSIKRFYLINYLLRYSHFRRYVTSHGFIFKYMRSNSCRTPDTLVDGKCKCRPDVNVPKRRILNRLYRFSKILLLHSSVVVIRMLQCRSIRNLSRPTTVWNINKPLSSVQLL